jgi:glycosyltransferase involved in cell wall biosynthesis
VGKKKIAVITSSGGIDRKTWSGTAYYMSRALEDHFGEVVHIEPPLSAMEVLGRFRDRVGRKILGRGRPHHHMISLAKKWGAALRERIPSDTDVVFAPAASTQIAFLDVDCPIVYTSDTTFRLICNYYPDFTGLSDRYQEWANEIERRAIEKASLLLYPSEWAANSAMDDYGADPAKIRIFPYGANLDAIPDGRAVPAAKREDRCVLTFLGVDWVRKGGPIAHETARLLRENGINAELVVIGCTPPEEYSAPWMRVIPWIDKGAPDGRDYLSTLLLRSSFLLLPSRQECFGIVFCEASAHGTPSIAAETGGVAGAVHHGKNGFLLPYDAPGSDYAALIGSIVSEPNRYQELVLNTRHCFDTRLNWRAWAEDLDEALRVVA